MMNLRLWDDELDHVVELPHGGPGAIFPVSELMAHIQRSGRDYIIQGQQNCALADHTKPHSLDVWLRQNFSQRKDSRQAVNQVVKGLVATGYFEVARLLCPDSGRMCKGLRLRSTR